MKRLGTVLFNDDNIRCVLDFPVKNIEQENEIQRPLIDAHVNSIVANMDYRIFDFPRLVYRDGKYYVLDGRQHLAAYRNVNAKKGDKLTVPVIILYGQNFTEECDLFIDFNNSRRALTVGQKLHAAFMKGDEQAVAIYNVVADLSLTLNLNNGVKKNENTITAITGLQTITEKHGAAHLRRVLSLLCTLFPGQSKKLDNNITQAMSEFLADRPQATNFEVKTILSGWSVDRINLQAMNNKTSCHTRHISLYREVIKKLYDDAVASAA